MKIISERFDKNEFSSQQTFRLIKGNAGSDGLKSELYIENSLTDVITIRSIPFTSFRILPLELSINRALKRSTDIFLSIIIITGILTWLIPVLAILIKSGSKGPVFFLQKRNKKNGRIFSCIKFRTMIVNEEADIKQAYRNDKRITGIGKFLRKNHIDELPQFINVLLGDMSVIGPRPHMISDNLRYEELVQDYSYRLKVKPGITGLAQAMGFAGSVTNINKMNNRVSMDNFYIRHWSLKLDMIILYRTIFKPFR